MSQKKSNRKVPASAEAKHIHQRPPKCAVLELSRDHNNKTLNTGIKPSRPKGSCNLKTQQNLIFKNTPWHYFKIPFVIQAGGSGAGRITARMVFVLKMRRVQDLCSTSSQVTLSSLGFIYKRNEFSLRGAAENQLYAPVSSSDQETPTPEAGRDAATWSAWQDGDIQVPAPASRQGTVHVCRHPGTGKETKLKQTPRLRVHMKARSHVGVRWDWRGHWPAGGIPPPACILCSTLAKHPPVMEVKWEF